MKKVSEGMFYLLYSQGIKKGFNMRATEVLRTGTLLVNGGVSSAAGLTYMSMKHP
jgi:hypothetical protein